MSTLRFVHTETLRLAELQLQELIHTPIEARFNRLARVARAALQTPVAAISLFDRECEWFKAVVGWNVAELPTSRSLATRVVDAAGARIIDDLSRHDDLAHHELVRGPPGFRFCAVHPLKEQFGHVIGAVAAYDTAPRASSPATLETLTDLGELVQRELLLGEVGNAQQQLLAKLDTSRREALLDDLTRLWNRRGGLELVTSMLARTGGTRRSFGLCVVDVDQFKAINDQFGHGVGDVVLRKLAAALVDCVRPDDIVCRLSGDEFLLVLAEMESAAIVNVMDRIRRRAEGMVIRTRSGNVTLTLSIGGYVVEPGFTGSVEEAIALADGALYDAKGAGRNHAVLSNAGDPTERPPRRARS